MLLLRNAGNASKPKLEVVEHRQCETLANRELASDAPGLSFSSGSPRRNAYDQGDPHAADESRFLSAAAETLDQTIEDGAASVIVVAPPRPLGILRRSYSSRTRAVLKAEIEKDLTRISVAEISGRLAEF